MSLIDWSDPEEMLGLLVEYVTDEALAEDRDPERAAFLRALARELNNLARRELAAVHQIADAIREIRASQPRELLDDAVIAHVDACVEELDRLGAGAQTSVSPP